MGDDQVEVRRRGLFRRRGKARGEGGWQPMLAAILLGAACTAGVSLVSLLPHENRPMAVFVWPWLGDQGAVRAVVDAHARLLAASPSGWVAVAMDAEPGLERRLYAAGAVFVADAAAASLCGVKRRDGGILR